MDPLALRSSQLPVCAARLRCRTSLGQGRPGGDDTAGGVRSSPSSGRPLVVVSQRLIPKAGRRSAISEARIGQHFGKQFQPIVALRGVLGGRLNKEFAGQATCSNLLRSPENL
jgi:hypothetical protein